ncbi:Dnmt3b [Symbiodinium natans]|uniref:Dnmt3b protein n=1 Tax=Symbiodinium natans TaxID=878477 RepID=A0A812TPC7_9DINO|nr:Dnmt3b [Symbiodinium natans]
MAEYIEGAGLSDYWAKQKALDATLLAGVWLLVVGLRIWSWQSDAAEDTLGALEVLAPVAYAFTTAMLLCACYLQNSKWRGISLAIAAFARSVLEGEISCMTARMKWRELIGAMRQTSRMYQLTAASLASTTVLVAFAMLYDIFKGYGANAVPNVVLALVMPSSLYVAACATADCTRLPSLLCMLDGDEDEEGEYMDLALFLTLSESGFFMWDTRVTLGVLQKFVYFTAAVVGTISFQLKLIAV